MLKILINAVSAKSGGTATYIRNLSRSLAKLEGQYQYIFYVPATQAKTMLLLGDHVTVVATEIGYKPPWQRFLWDQVTLRRIINKQKVNILLSSSDFGMLCPPCLQILMIRNPLFFSQFYLERILPRKSLRFRLDFLVRRWLSALSARSSNVVITASHSMLNNVRCVIPIPESKVGVNYFGVPLEKFNEKWWEVGKPEGEGGRMLRESPLRLLYVSEYSDYKNLTTLLKAVLVLRQLGRDDFRLVTTMDPGQFPDMEIVTRELDRSLASHPLVAPYVTFTGHVGYEEVERLYQQADLFVFPSLAESFGHPLVEAMASGLPIIASDIPIHREICSDAAEYFSPLNPKDLAEKIVLLRNNRGVRRRLGKIGRKRAEMQFDWKDHVRRLVEIFGKVAAHA